MSLLAGDDASTLAALLHQGYRQRTDGVGDQVAPCWVPCADGVVGPYWLVIARNVLDPNEVKYFLSNAASGVPLSAILHVAFGCWPVERCLQDEKSELGLSHFEVRCYPALKRHLLITQVSHLFLARQTQRLRGEKSGDHIAASPHGHERLDRHTPASRAGTIHAIEPRRSTPGLLAATQCASAKATRKHVSANSNGTTSTSLSYPDVTLHELPRCAVVLDAESGCFGKMADSLDRLIDLDFVFHRECWFLRHP